MTAHPGVALHSAADWVRQHASVGSQGERAQRGTVRQEGALSQASGSLLKSEQVSRVDMHQPERGGRGVWSREGMGGGEV